MPPSWPLRVPPPRQLPVPPVWPLCVPPPRPLHVPPSWPLAVPPPRPLGGPVPEPRGIPRASPILRLPPSLLVVSHTLPLPVLPPRPRQVPPSGTLHRSAPFPRGLRLLDRLGRNSLHRRGFSPLAFVRCPGRGFYRAWPYGQGDTGTACTSTALWDLSAHGNKAIFTTDWRKCRLYICLLKHEMALYTEGTESVCGVVSSTFPRYTLPRSPRFVNLQVRSKNKGTTLYNFW